MTESLFKIVNLEVQTKTENFLVLVGCPNYEERSISCFQKHSEIFTEKKSSKLLRFEILFLKNKINNNIILEELKNQYVDALKQDLRTNKINNNWYKIDYPNNFSLRELNTKLLNNLRKYSLEKKVDIHIDITAMPRSLIFGLCESITKWMEDDTIKIENIYFTYFSPKQFSRLPYAQEIGLLKGSIKGVPIQLNENSDIRTVIFPSMTGHESKLLLDELNQISGNQKNAIFFQLDSNDFLTSLETMRANQILMEQGDNTQYYYCSLYEAIKELNLYIKKEEDDRKAESKNKKRQYLIAPFGAKAMLPISFFTLKKLQNNCEKNVIDIEICHAQGFQYTSVYSIGVGESNTFSFNIEEWKQK